MHAKSTHILYYLNLLKNRRHPPRDGDFLPSHATRVVLWGGLTLRVNHNVSLVTLREMAFGRDTMVIFSFIFVHLNTKMKYLNQIQITYRFHGFLVV